MDELKTKVEKPRNERPARRPVGATDRLNIINRDPDREYRLINSDPSRIAEIMAAGYRIEQIKDHLPSVGMKVEDGSTVDNMLHVGLGDKHILVSIEKEFYEEDQKAKLKKADKLEAGIYPTDSDGLYGNVSIKR